MVTYKRFTRFECPSQVLLVFGPMKRKPLATPKNRCCNSVRFWYLPRQTVFMPPSWNNGGQAWKQPKLNGPNIKISLLNEKLPKIASAFRTRNIFENTDFGTCPKSPHNYLGKAAHSRNATTHTGIWRPWQHLARSFPHERAHSYTLNGKNMALLTPSANMCI